MLIQSRPSYAAQNQNFGAELVLSRPLERALRSASHRQVKNAKKLASKDAYVGYRSQNAKTQIKALRMAFQKLTKGIDVKVKMEERGIKWKEIAISFEHEGQKYVCDTNDGRIIPNEFFAPRLLGGVNPNSKAAVINSAELFLEKLASADPVCRGNKSIANPFIDSYEAVAKARAALKPYHKELPRKPVQS